LPIIAIWWGIVVFRLHYPRKCLNVCCKYLHRLPANKDEFIAHILFVKRLTNASKAYYVFCFTTESNLMKSKEIELKLYKILIRLIAI
jgi:hypothetical protein